MPGAPTAPSDLGVHPRHKTPREALLDHLRVRTGDPTKIGLRKGFSFATSFICPRMYFSASLSPLGVVSPESSPTDA